MKGSPVQQQVAMDAASGVQQSPRDCVHFLRTGTCRYGPNCRFNHPGQGLDAMQATSYPFQISEFPERIGQPDCQFYLKTGTCKFGVHCKYNHPHVKAGSARGPPLLNFVGLPMRPGEKECAFYLRTGSCKFGVACKFHHPDPAGIGVARSPSYPNNAPSSPATIPAWRPVFYPGSGIPGSSPYMPMYPPLSPQNIPFNGGWPAYPTMGMPLSNGDHRGYFDGAQQHVAGMRPPLDGPLNCSPRPEQQDCQYYVQTGHCKFGVSCKYQHPKSTVIPVVAAALSPMGLPLRSGQPLCTFYLKNGICKFGPVCRYDHPIRAPSMSIPPFPEKEINNVEEESSPVPKNSDGKDELDGGLAAETENATLQDGHDIDPENVGD
ncbi:hypothetical protein L7F22_000960 [Adiantum nelumboides]|nr:hypothetical protein [Adiantum nelumboides]